MEIENLQLTFDNQKFKNEMKLAHGKIMDKEQAICMTNAAKINFMLDNVKINGHEDNRAIMLLLRPMRMLNMTLIEENTVETIFYEVMRRFIILINEIHPEWAVNDLIKLQSVLPIYDNEEKELAGKILNKIKKQN